LDVVLLDRIEADKTIAPDYDGRCIAVAHASVQLFKGIDAWRHIGAEAEAMLDIRITDGNAPVILQFEHQNLGDDPFGYMVEMRHLRAGLMQALDECPNVTLMAPTTVTSVDPEPGHTIIKLDGQPSIRARLAVAADGRASPLRQAAGIKTVGDDYGQTGIVTTIEHELPHHGVACEHFLPPGPFAILPLRGNRSSLVWAEKPEVAKAILGLDDDAFNQEIKKRVGDFLGTIRATGPRFSYPFGVHVAEKFNAERLALIGDAAHGIHPIAGQGINLGWRDVAALAELVVDANRLGLDIGGPDLLARYDRWRRVDTIVLAAVTDGLNRLFSNNIAPVRLVRDMGLAVVQRLGPVKKVFMRYARGSAGALPRLLKGESL
jgi:2-octaprenyl-6-methoxyphenol hydroxylase